MALLGALTFGWVAPLAAVAIALITRLEMTRWSLICGLEAGMQVAAALKRSILSRFGVSLGLAAAVSIGLAVPIFVRHTMWVAGLGYFPPGFLALCAIFLAIVLRAGARLPAYRLALLAGTILLIYLQVQRR
jgi:hypothetical protein